MKLLPSLLVIVLTAVAISGHSQLRVLPHLKSGP